MEVEEKEEEEASLFTVCCCEQLAFAPLGTDETHMHIKHTQEAM